MKLNKKTVTSIILGVTGATAIAYFLKKRGKSEENQESERGDTL